MGIDLTPGLETRGQLVTLAAYREKFQALLDMLDGDRFIQKSEVGHRVKYELLAAYLHVKFAVMQDGCYDHGLDEVIRYEPGSKPGDRIHYALADIISKEAMEGAIERSREIFKVMTGVGDRPRGLDDIPDKLEWDGPPLTDHNG